MQILEAQSLLDSIVIYFGTEKLATHYKRLTSL